MMTIPGFAAETSLSRPTRIHHIASASNASFDPAVVPAQTGSRCCPPGFFCPSCTPLPCVSCTDSYWTGFCQDFTACPDGTKSPIGATYWCGVFSGGAHFGSCS